MSSASPCPRKRRSPPFPRPRIRGGQQSRAANQFYVRPFIDIQGASVSGGGSNSTAFFGVGGGLKIPLRDRIASRFEANFEHGDGSDYFGLLAGLSFYTR